MARAAALGCLLLTLFAQPASAEWHIVPMVGYTMFGDTSIVDPTLGTNRRRPHVGGAVSWLSRGLFGMEAIAHWTPSMWEGEQELFAPVDEASSRAVSVMANALLTLPQRWTEYGLRPFVSAGVGLVHAANGDPIFPADFVTTGFNVGGGAVGFLSPRTGIRFDVRYHGTLRRPEDTPSLLGPPHLRYVTASIGLVFRR